MRALQIFLICCLFGSALLINSCKAPKEVDDLTEADLRFKMIKGACFGKCPIYKIEIYEGGYTKFYGDRFCDKLGIYDKTLSKEAYKMLVNSFEDANFYDFKDEYESNVPDAPLVKISYKSKNNPIKNVTGKLNRPQELRELQVLLEDIASSKDWNLIEKYEEEIEEVKKDTKPKVIKTEIIIEPKEDIMLSNWFSEKKKLYGVRIIKKIAPNLNLWLITYDTKKVDGDMILQILQNDSDIISAEFNKKTSLRGN